MGSEMCIRDSSRTDRTVFKTASGEAAFVASGVLMRPDGAPFSDGDMLLACNRYSLSLRCCLFSSDDCENVPTLANCVAFSQLFDARVRKAVALAS